MSLWKRVAELEVDGHSFDRVPFKSKNKKRGIRYWWLAPSDPIDNRDC